MCEKLESRFGLDEIFWLVRWETRGDSLSPTFGGEVSQCESSTGEEGIAKVVFIRAARA